MLCLKGHFRASVRYPSGRTIWLPPIPNGIITDTTDDVLEVYFRSGVQIAQWYIGLVDNDGFTALSASDTMGSHSGWTENEDYSEAARPEWAPAAAASGILTNATGREFTIDTATEIKGIFITSDSTKGGTDGTLWSHGSFPTVQSLPIGAVFKAFYELRAREG